MFDGIARRYDLLNHLLSLGIDRGWRRRVVRMVRLHRPAEILDMATGAGDLASMLAEACPAAQITGIDLSERMLAIGREKVERKGKPFLTGQALPTATDAVALRRGAGIDYLALRIPASRTLHKLTSVSCDFSYSGKFRTSFLFYHKSEVL